MFSNAIADLLIGVIVTPLALYQETIGWPMAFPCEIWIAIDVACCTASKGIQNFLKSLIWFSAGYRRLQYLRKSSEIRKVPFAYDYFS